MNELTELEVNKDDGQQQRMSQFQNYIQSYILSHDPSKSAQTTYNISQIKIQYQNWCHL